MESSGRATEVMIFGKVYHLRGERKPEELRRLARLVDAQMREIAPDPAHTDAMKVAVLAAINLADEVERFRQGFEEREGHLETVSARLSAVLADCLEVAEGTDRRVGPELDGSIRSQ